MKTYNKPFSKTNHEALTAADYKWVKWEDGKMAPYNDETTKSLKPADFKK
jgi:branched-chain amino acid transport system substrate-binding protein